MIPAITKGNLLMLPKKKQLKICNCPKKCTRFFTFENDDTDFMLCENNTKIFGEQLFKEFLPDEAPEKIDGWGWTEEQEKFLIDYVKEFGVKYGTYNIIANAINKSRDQVRIKAQRLRKQGNL